MKARHEIRRLEKAARALPDPGCAACRDRRGMIVLVEDGDYPARCDACGIRPEFVIEFTDAPGNGSQEDLP